jgi:acyl carrier protein
VKTFGVEEARITPSAHLVEDLELDSLDWTELLVTLRARHRPGCQRERGEGIRTVADLLDLLDRKHAASA